MGGTLQCGIRAWRESHFIGVQADFNPETGDFDSRMIVPERGPDGDLIPGPTYPVPVLDESETFECRRPDGRPYITSRVPFTHGPAYPLGPGGDFWVTQGGGAYRIQRQTVEGDALRIIERDYVPVPIPASVRDSALAELDLDERGLPADFGAARVPTVFPPFEVTEATRDGGLWLRRRIEGSAFAFDVFDPEGIYLGLVREPEGYGGMRVYDVTPDHIYGRSPTHSASPTRYG